MTDTALHREARRSGIKEALLDLAAEYGVPETDAVPWARAQATALASMPDTRWTSSAQKEAGK